MDLFIFTFTYIQIISLLVNGAAIDDNVVQNVAGIQGPGVPGDANIPNLPPNLPPSDQSINVEAPNPDKSIVKADSNLNNIASLLGAAQDSFPDMSEDDLRKLIAVLQLGNNAISPAQESQDPNSPAAEAEKPTLYSNGQEQLPLSAVPQIREPAIQQVPGQNTGCNNYPHETDSTRFYQLGRDGRQHLFPCAPGTVYNSQACRCDWADTSFPGIPFLAADAGNQIGTVNVKPNEPWKTNWSGKCRTLMKMSFDNGIQDEAGFYTINHGVTLDASSGNNAGRFDGSSYVEAAVFTGNELGDTVDISFRFKPEGNSGDNQYHVLLSNECKRKWLVDGFLSSSVAFKYRPASGDLLISLETATSKVDGSCKPVANGNGWFDVDLTLENGRLSSTVNGQTCFASNVEGHISNKQCAMGIGNSLSGNGTPFTGLIDEVSIVKGCVQ